MQAYYDARATEYDAVYQKPERQPDLAAISRWLPQVFEGRRVLEIACGTGWWTRLLASAASQVLALDASAQTLTIARQRGLAPSRVEFRLGNAYAPPHGEPPFEAAFAGFWWSHVPRARLAAFLESLHACLAPGAVVVFLDNRFVPGSSTAISHTDAQGDTWQERQLSDGSRHAVLKNFPDEAQLRDAVAGVDPAAVVHLWRHYWALEYRKP